MEMSLKCEVFINEDNNNNNDIFTRRHITKRNLSCIPATHILKKYGYYRIYLLLLLRLLFSNNLFCVASAPLTTTVNVRGAPPFNMIKYIFFFP